MPGPDQLRGVRDFLSVHHESFRSILADKTLKKLMGQLIGDSLARIPKGFPPDHPAADLIKRKNWILYDTRLDPKTALTPQLLKEIVKRFRTMTPFIESLNRALAGKRPTEPLLPR